MVQGLAFLSKKSWHTKNKANQEKVWLAEERKRAEDQRTHELAKQIQQEREQAELEKITGKQNHRDRGIDWMYQGGNPQSQIAQEDAKKQAEEYLLGKEYVPAAGAAKGDLDTAESTTEGVHAVVAASAAATETEKTSSAAPAYAEPSVQERNEAFRMRHEDPMFAVSRRVAEKKDEYDKKKELYERVVGGVAVDVVDGKPKKKKRKRDKEERHRSRKREKKERRRHHHRGRRHRNDDSDLSASEQSDEQSDRGRSRHRSRRRRSRSRSPSFDSDTDRRGRSRAVHSHRDDRRHSHRRSRSRSRSPSPSRHHNSHRRRYRSRSPSWDDRERSPDQYRGDRNNRDYSDRAHSRSDHSRHHHHRSDHRSSRPNDYKRHKDDDRKRPPPPREVDASRMKDPPPSQSPPPEERPAMKDGYGLQGGSASAPSRRSGDLGPDQNLLHRKRQEREDERSRARQAASSRRQWTAEERAEALRAMEDDAQRRQETRPSKKRDDDDDDSPTSGNAAFLRDVQKAAHGLSANKSMSERLQQNRNTNQRSNESFF